MNHAAIPDLPYSRPASRSDRMWMETNSDTMKHTSPLATRRLLLRPWEETDAEALYRYARHPAVGPAAGWAPHTSVEDSLHIIRTVFSAPETYAVVLKETGEPVGSVGIMRGDGLHSAEMKADEGEIGYWIGVPYWGQGLIPEAVCRLLQRCFVDLAMAAVWCGYYEGNTKSRRVMEKCGFRFHHTEEGKVSPLGDVRTEHFMRITREEWESGQIRILSVTADKKRYLPLLLVGDEQESMVDRYLDRGEMFVMQDAADKPVAVAVVTDEGGGVLELKNLAVHPLFQRKGYGRKMIEYLCRRYGGRYHTLLAGTGDSRKTTSFYGHCGFVYSHTIAGFFLKHYDHPIVEEGVTLKDMLYFKRTMGEMR